MTEGKGFQLGTVGALSLSVISSVSIVICNKALMSSLGFHFATTLTSWHLLVTFCSLHVALKLKFFEHKAFDRSAVMGFGVLNGISIGLLNLSLGFNSVGFYQMTKLAIIPCTVFLETVFLTKKFSRSIQVSLAVLLLGVGIATITDLQLNALGSFLSLLAILTTCVAQIMTNTIQKKFKVSSTQLLYQSCPYQAATLLVTGPFLDKLLTDDNVFAFNYTTEVLVFIIMSCLISVSVNFSTFLVIGKTSPVTYQVLGHLKTCLVLAFGYILLHDPFSWRNILGILIAIVGMVLYSYRCTIEGQKKSSEVLTQMTQVILCNFYEINCITKTGRVSWLCHLTLTIKAPATTSLALAVSPTSLRENVLHRKSRTMALRAMASRKTLTNARLGLGLLQSRSLQTFSLPDLSYDYGALEPAISGEIMQIHHQKHHQTYITNYNKALEQLEGAMAKGDAPSVAKLQSAIKFNGGGHINHSIFWKNLTPVSHGGGEPPHGSLGWAIDANFGSLEPLIKKMNAEGAALQGSGWVWLGLDKESKRLVIETTANQDPLVTKGASLIPLLGIDVWEHAYYLQYKNVRPDYLNNIWKVMNWKYASEVFEKECPTERT